MVVAAFFVAMGILALVAPERILATFGTTGLTAGADSRNVNAAAGATPRETRRPAMGTDPHSQPGSATPATAATGTARTGLAGSARASALGGT